MKPITIKVTIDVYYDFEGEFLPSFATPAGMRGMVEAAFDDNGPPADLTYFGADGVLRQNPVEVAIKEVKEE